jgi:hypothetical protein
VSDAGNAIAVTLIIFGTRDHGDFGDLRTDNLPAASANDRRWVNGAPSTVVDIIRPTSVIGLPATAVDLVSGGFHQLSASVLPVNASQRITWETTNKDIADVSDTGLVTAGTTRILQLLQDTRLELMAQVLRL